MPNKLAAIQALFLGELPRLRGFAYGMTGDHALADDVVQECFVVVQAKAETFVPGSDFTAWTRAIARRKVLELLRFRGRTGGLIDASLVDTLAEAAPPVELWDAERAALGACIDRLAPTARRIVGLRYLDGLMPGEIAKKVTWTVNAVHVALSRARTALRQCVGAAVGRS